MRIRLGDGERTVRAFVDAYLIHRSLEEAASYLCEDIQWVGTGASEFIRGKAAVLKVLGDEFSQAPDACQVAYSVMEEQMSSACCAVVLCLLRVTGPEGLSFETRLTATCVMAADGCKLASIHASLAAESQEEGAYFPIISTDGADIEHRISTKSVDILGRSIPGGILGGYLEPGLPLYYINQGMLHYLGYLSSAEFRATVGGLVTNCIHPEDRARVEQSVLGGFSKDQEYELQYRIAKKDGSYLWVNEIGKRGVAENGRHVCIGVVRDISAEVRAREHLAEKAAEKAQQALRYDRLYQSVLCGIIQYQIGDSWRAKFKNANREAIRIMGYTEEAFWARADWDLPGLFAPEDRARIMADLRSIRAVGDKRSFEYRILQGDGNVVWVVGSVEMVLDTDGDQVLQSVFLDVDSRKKAEQKNRRLTEQVEASNEILRLALEHTTTCEFYYYPRLRTCMVPPRTQAYYGLEQQYENMPEGFAGDMVDPASNEAYCEMFRQLHGGTRSTCAEFRLNSGKWCRQTMSVLSYTDQAEPYCVVGIIEDITKHKEMEAALLETRSRDSLTGLYNHDTGVRLVQDYLERTRAGEDCTLMLLDMDDFEQINRKAGRVFADAILQEVADILRGETGPEDYQIRLGGDEFMLLVKNCDKARASVLGPRIAARVKEIFLHTEKKLQISASIGMCATQVTDVYNVLYRCAESTLNYVKSRKKGDAACYLDTSNELGSYLTQAYSKQRAVNEIDSPHARRREDLIALSLDLLGKSQNLNDAVFLLLARVGKRLDLDRVTIAEADWEYQCFRFTYQWSRDHACLQLEQEWYVTAALLEHAGTLYEADGLSQRTGNNFDTMPSCLHAGMWNYGKYSGSMSFERAEEGYLWSEEQRRLLQELVQIIPSFIMKAKADAVSRAKTDFLSRMSHEIRTPMNAISGMTTIAKNVLNDREKTLECLEKIEAANGFLLELINDILDMSRIESGKMELHLERTDLDTQARSLQSMMLPQAQVKEIRLEFENGCGDSPPVMADALRLNQVMVNIIGNALKFTPPGGKVMVSVTPISRTPEEMTVRFCVRDTGIGIEQGALERIFNPFEQAEAGTASRYGGTGLGLSISSSLVQMMGGMLEVNSQVDRGSEFYFTLCFALASQGAPSAAQRRAQGKEMDFSGKRLLLAEDNSLNQEIVKTILEMSGFVVETAEDGSVALERFAGHAPGYYDGILMDIRMPVMDGLEATRRIRTLGRADSRTIPILALTANAFDEDTQKSMESGMNGHLSKPLQIEKLLELLSDCFSQEESDG